MKMKKIFTVAMITAGLLGITETASVKAENVVNASLSPEKTQNEVYYGLSAKNISEILKKSRLDFEETKDEWNDPQFFIYLDNSKEIVLWAYGCEKGMCKDLRLWSYWKTKNNPIDLKQINRWNSQQRWTKAYIDRDSDAVLEMDFDADGGITIDGFMNFLEIYIKHLHQFKEFTGMQ